jgi:hypothetical protein
MDQVTGVVEYTASTEPAQLPSLRVTEQTVSPWIVPVEEDERQQMETPTERRAREERQEIKDHRHFLEQDGRFRKIVQVIRRLQDATERREAIRNFWNEMYEEVYADPLVQVVNGDPLWMRATALQVYTAMGDEERREMGRELHVGHPHAPFRGPIIAEFPLRGPRSAGVALLQE